MSSAVPIIAIDGPSGSGKGTVSRAVAEALGWHFLDSGSLYRLVALAGIRRGLASDDEAGHAALAARLDARFETDDDGVERIFLGAEEVSAELLDEHCGTAASRIAALPGVRRALVDRQRGFARWPGLVADGRDMGTVIFPSAGLKIFLTASPEERARRRHKQLKEKGIDVSLAALSAEIAERDRRDAARAVAPLKAAEDALVLDTTRIPVTFVVDRILETASERFGAAPCDAE